MTPLRRGGNVEGFTLVEVMVAASLGVIVLGTVISAVLTQKRSYEVQGQVTTMQQYLRVGMDLMMREVRLAGFGRPTWTVWNSTSSAYDIAYTVQVTDGTPDTIDIIGCFDDSVGKIETAAAKYATTLILKSGHGSKFNTTTKSDIFLPNIGNARITAITGDVLTIDTDPPNATGLLEAVPVDTVVYIVKHHTYLVSNNILTRNENTGAGAQQVTLYVDDLQSTFATSTAMMSLTLETKSERADPDYTHPTESDGFRRRSQTVQIGVRNF